MTTSSSSYDWVHEIKPSLKNLDAIPLTGSSPPFPWEEFSLRLARSFDRENFIIQPSEMRWRTKDELFEGLGDSPFPLNFSIPSLQGQVSWVMPAQEITLLAAWLLTQNLDPSTFHDQTLTESFYHFLALEVLYHFTQVSSDQSLFPILAQQTQLPDQDSLCWDISIRLPHQTLWGRLILSPEFRHSWVEHFAKKQEATLLSQQMAQLAPIIVHLEAGKTHLTLADWISVQEGDFIILDQYFLDSEQLDGRIMLTIQGKPAFRAKIKDRTLKILELPLLHEVETSMANQSDDDDLNDLDLPEEDEFEDEDLFSDTDDLFSEDEEIEPPVSSKEETNPSIQTQTAAAQPTIPSSEVKRAINPEQIPITLVVEIGQIQISMEQLLKLEPGNLLEINLRPEDGVDLTINGKVVGKGELIRIGETLGVRVLEVGRK